MDVRQAVTYIFEDQNWRQKLAILGALSFSVVLMPLGLISLVVLLGYTVQLVDNVRSGHPRPLPRWSDYGTMLMEGANVLLMWCIFGLPMIVLSGCILTLSNAVGSSLFGGMVVASLACCLVPFLLIYSVAVLPLTTVGMVRYSETRRAEVFYQFGENFSIARTNAGATMAVILHLLVANFVFGLLLLIPCLGWLAVLLLAVPVQGHLLGQYGALLGQAPLAEKPKRPV